MPLTQKICLTPAEQIAFLEARGISFTDKNAAKRILRHIGLAHLKPYWLDGAISEFDDIIQLYKFDSDLKLLWLLTSKQWMLGLNSHEIQQVIIAKTQQNF